MVTGSNRCTAGHAFEYPLSPKNANPSYGKRWRLYILPQYLANLTDPLAQKESHILAKFIPVLTQLCMQGLEFSDLLCAFL